jgi:hypothetical protein
MRKRESIHLSGAPLTEAVPLLGLTWHTRGLSYWFRRCLIVLVELFVISISSLALYGVFSSGVNAGSIAILAIIVFVGMPFAVGIWRRTVPRYAERRLGPRERVVWLVFAALTPILLFATGGEYLVILSAAASCAFLVVLWRSCARELYIEKPARERLQRWQDQQASTEERDS